MYKIEEKKDRKRFTRSCGSDILLTVPCTFHMVVIERICLNIDINLNYLCWSFQSLLLSSVEMYLFDEVVICKEQLEL